MPGAASAVTFRFTHGSLVFLTEEAVFKIKRPKDYGFFDYSSQESRRYYCSEEVRLNRRTAPSVYLDVLPVYRDEAGYSLNRPNGDIVDHAVHMRRLPDERNAESLLIRGELSQQTLEQIARFMARFYATTTAHPPAPDHLGSAMEENFAQMQPFVGSLINAAQLSTLQKLQRAWLAHHARLLGQRPRRDGHGDLRLEHVYLINDEILVIDCIEFCEAFRVADPMLDAAFLAMDLAERQRRDLAEHFLAAFAEASHDFTAMPLLDGYMSYRATVRGKVAGFVAAAPETPPQQAARKADKARSLFALAQQLLQPRQRRLALIAVGGSIASGKSTLARALARRLCLPVVQADATRKSLAGLADEAAGDASLYTKAFTQKVQTQVLLRAVAVLRSGRSVVVDTTLRSRAFRERLRQTAAEENATFRLIECQVPPAVARQRLRQREHTANVSDAREDLLDSFLANWDPINELPTTEHVTVSGETPAPQLADQLVDFLGVERP